VVVRRIGRVDVDAVLAVVVDAVADLGGSGVDRRIAVVAVRVDVVAVVVRVLCWLAAVVGAAVVDVVAVVAAAAPTTVVSLVATADEREEDQDGMEFHGVSWDGGLQ